MVAAIQGVVLITVAAGWLSRPVEVLLTVAALALLAESFGHDVLWLARDRFRHPESARCAASGAGDPLAQRSRARALVGQLLTVAAVVLIWLALAWPDKLGCQRVAQYPRAWASSATRGADSASSRA